MKVAEQFRNVFAHYLYEEDVLYQIWNEHIIIGQQPLLTVVVLDYRYHSTVFKIVFYDTYFTMEESRRYGCKFGRFSYDNPAGTIMLGELIAQHSDVLHRSEK